ncbi:hypothetical protein HD601_004462 [Jiangella mangrovi]|uniref:Uncharacterized protein n=1 Tax=Jiangella mangrovi TaxID=1524084 RepID=A0A7W9GTR6_9ACTN|nr:hypothetical protein [Jiangella mangrovi]
MSFLVLGKPSTQLSIVERPLGAKCARERPTTLGLVEASLTRVQVRTPAREPSVEVGNQRPFGAGTARDDTEQFGLDLAGPATYAGAHR